MSANAEILGAVIFFGAILSFIIGVYNAFEEGKNEGYSEDQYEEVNEHVNPNVEAEEIDI